MRTFDFNISHLALNSIDIEDIGNCAIECKNDDNLFFILIIRTTMGTSSIYTCGPFNPDVNLLPTGFSSSLTRLDFNISKIEKIIMSFLNDKYAKITSAQEISLDEAIDEFVDFKQYLENYGNEVY